MDSHAPKNSFLNKQFLGLSLLRKSENQNSTTFQQLLSLKIPVLTVKSNINIVKVPLCQLFSLIRLPVNHPYNTSLSTIGRCMMLLRSGRKVFECSMCHGHCDVGSVYHNL